LISALIDLQSLLKGRKTQAAFEYADGIIEAVREPLLVLDTSLKVTKANRSFYESFKVIPEKTIGSFIYDLGNGQWDIPRLRTLLEDILSRNINFDGYEVEHEFPGIGHKIMLVNAHRILQKETTSQEILLAIEDVTERRHAEEMMRESERRFKEYTQNAPLGIFITNDVGKYVFVNPAACQMTGYTQEELLSLSISEFLAPESLNEGLKLFNKVQISGFAEGEVLVRKKTGETFWIALTSSKLNGSRYFAFCSDITNRKQTEEALRDRQKELQTIMDAAPMAITWSDMEGNIQYINHAFHELFGYTLEDIPTTVDFRRLAYPSKTDLEAYTARVLDQRKRLKQGEEAIPIEVAITCKDGSVRHVEALGTVASNKRMVIYTDITGRKQAEETFRQMAYHDSLTGLPNRKLFADRLGIALVQAKRNKKIIGVAMLDLDNFKNVNDTLGHGVGDLLLKAATERLSAVLRKGDTVARFGGDEFVLILPDLKATEDTIQVAQKIVDSFCKPFLIDTHQLTVTTSIGIAIYPDDGIDEVMLLKNADIAMYQAKQAGRSRYQLYKKA
jgi:diguanylate cyclase (GGDEF)-like protein/PAS domain S-box-containing protein